MMSGNRRRSSHASQNGDFGANEPLPLKRSDTTAVGFEATSLSASKTDGTSVIKTLIWTIINIFFLDFARKFDQRIRIYANATDDGVDKWREAQQEEWNRLGTTVTPRQKPAIQIID